MMPRPYAVTQKGSGVERMTRRLTLRRSNNKLVTPAHGVLRYYTMHAARLSCHDWVPASMLPLSAAAIKPIKSEALPDMLHLKRIVDRVLWRGSLKDRDDVPGDHGGHVA
jgi:hypothetical protein